MPKGIVIELKADGSGVDAALRQIEAKMQEVQARQASMATEVEAAGRKIESAFEGTTPRIAAASGAIRELEGNLPIRAVERFLSDTLKLGPALQAAFPLIGGIAFGEMLIHIGDELGKFSKDATDISVELGESWMDAATQKIAGLGDEIKTAEQETLKWGENFDKLQEKIKNLTLKNIEDHSGPMAEHSFESNSTIQQITANQEFIKQLQDQVALQTAFIADREKKGPIEPGDFERSQDLLHKVQGAGLSDSVDVAKEQVKAAEEQIKALFAEIAVLRQEDANKAIEANSKELDAFKRHKDEEIEAAKRAAEEIEKHSFTVNVGKTQEEQFSERAKFEAMVQDADNAEAVAFQKQLDGYTDLNEFSQAYADSIRDAAGFAQTAAVFAEREAKARQQVQEQIRVEKESETDNQQKSGVKFAADEVTTAMTRVSDQLLNAASGGKNAMRNLKEEVIRDLDQIASKILEKQFIGPLLQKLFSFIPGIGSTSGSEVDSINASGIIGNAGGGDVPGDGPILVGDAGPEVFVPSGPGTVLPNQLLSSIRPDAGASGAPNVTINNINNSSSPVQMKQTGAQWDSAAKEFIVHTVLEDWNQGGPVSQAMKANG